MAFSCLVFQAFTNEIFASIVMHVKKVVCKILKGSRKATCVIIETYGFNSSMLDNVHINVLDDGQC